MEKRIKQVSEYVLEEHEARMALAALDYARHRLETAPNSGIHKAGVRKTQVEKLCVALRGAIATHV